MFSKSKQQARALVTPTNCWLIQGIKITACNNAGGPNARLYRLIIYNGSLAGVTNALAYDLDILDIVLT